MSFKGSQYISVIGEGAQSIVEKHLYQNETVAIKIYNQVDTALLRELYVFQKLKNCSSINQMLDIDIHFKNIKILMTNYSMDLNTYMHTIPLSLRIQQGEMVLNQLLDALYQLHTRTIIHCDIKPENILVMVSNNLIEKVVLADFGLSLISKSFYIRGSYTYYAPELLMQRKYTDKIDIWALGITMLEYYLDDYISLPPMSLYNQYDDDNQLMALHLLTLVTKPNSYYLSIADQHDHINVGLILPNINKHKLIHMLQLNPNDRASIIDLYQGEICPVEMDILSRGPTTTSITSYYQTIYVLLENAELLHISPITCVMAIDLLERLLANYNINIKVYAAACLLLMNKIEDHIDITFQDMSDYFGTFTSNELQFTELSILKKMNYILIDNENEFIDELYTLIKPELNLKKLIMYQGIYTKLVAMYKKLEENQIYPGELFYFELIDYF